MDKSKGKRLGASEIQEVAELMSIKAEIDRFKMNHEAIFQEYSELTERYNSALEAAEKAVRAKGITCGPFINYSTRMTIDADKMYDEIGKEDFLKYGGRIVERTVYEIDNERVTRHIEAGDIPAEAAKEFMKVSRNYRKPDKLVV